MAGSDLGHPDAQLLLDDLTPAQIRRAQLRVAELALDVEDARLLLDMLGIKEQL